MTTLPIFFKSTSSSLLQSESICRSMQSVPGWRDGKRASLTRCAFAALDSKHPMMAREGETGWKISFLDGTLICERRKTIWKLVQRHRRSDLFG